MSALEWAVQRPDGVVIVQPDETEARGYVRQGNSDGLTRYRLLMRPVAPWTDATPDPAAPSVGDRLMAGMGRGMSPAEIMREAALLMRERARAADGPLPWWTSRALSDVAAKLTVTRREAEADGEFIASWDPIVALAVADWLDDEADWQGRPSGPGRLSRHNPALTVACAYLGCGWGHAMSDDVTFSAEEVQRLPMPLHALARDEDGRATATCSAPIGSVCRLVCAESCDAESWPCGRYDDDPDEQAHPMRDDGECHVVLFLQDDPDGCAMSFVDDYEYVGAITVEWNGDYYTWTAAASVGDA